SPRDVERAAYRSAFAASTSSHSAGWGPRMQLEPAASETAIRLHEPCDFSLLGHMPATLGSQIVPAADPPTQRNPWMGTVERPVAGSSVNAAIRLAPRSGV